jgi:hypothetical protein
VKIRLTKDVPVEKKHGMTKGRVLEIVSSGYDCVVVMGDDEEEVTIQWHEYEEIQDDRPFGPETPL